MKNFTKRFCLLILGLFLYALGAVLTIKAHIGYAPWDVLHVGLSKTLGISIGTASIGVGLIIAFITFLLKEKLGIGTILNMILIGLFIDLLMWIDIFPVMDNFISGLILLILGLFVISFGSYFYIGAAFGAGPRDSLMISVKRKTRLPIGVSRAIVEIFAVLAGWKLGGMVGIGTVISAFAIGFCIQITFKILKFETTNIHHETFEETYKALFKGEVG